MKIVTADITGSLIVNGVDVTNNVVSSSVFSGSIAGRVTNLEQFSASLDATFATDASVTASILVLSQSVQVSQAALSSSYALTSGSYVAISASYLATSASYLTTSASYAASSASLSVRVTNTEATASTNTQASASFAAQSASLSTRLTTDETNITTLTNASSSFATTSGSVAGRVTLIEGQYATTGSNIFTGTQRITQASNAISFTSTASLYTDGGLRVSKDSFVSGTAYFNNVVVYGTSSIQYITSSQVNFGTNIITVNTDTPAVRFGGLAVFDSGSTQLTGSMLWDSEKNHWIYSNPSGSTYNSAMLMNGPRNTGSLGNEQGTTACAMMIGQGGDHITSSMIYSYGNATCFYGNSYIDNTGLACFADAVCATTFKSKNLIVCEGSSNATIASSNNEVLRIQGSCSLGMFITYVSGSTIIGDTGNSSQAFSSGNATGFGINARDSRVLQLGTNQAFRMTIAATGETTFACQVCAPTFIGGTMSGTTIYGSTAVCSPVGKFTTCIDAGSGYFSGILTVNAGNSATSANIYNNGDFISNWIGNSTVQLFSIRNNSTTGVFLNTQNSAPLRLGVSTGTTGGTIVNHLEIASTGVATFACGVNIGTAGSEKLNIFGAGSQFINVKNTTTNADMFVGMSSALAAAFIGTGGTDPIVFSTAGTERMRITSTGIACFACQVCAPQYITTQGSSVSYAAGTNYIAWSSESEICSQDNNTGGTYTTMKTWIADRTGCLTLRFAGYIQAGPNYFAWRVVKNGSSSFVCGDYIGPLAPGCSTSVHAYTTFQSNIGSVNPGDCVTLQMVSSTGGGTPVSGAGQYLFAKELRLSSTTPNFSAGSSSNIFGDRLGVGTCIPGDVVHIETPVIGGMGMIIRNSCGATSLTSNCSLISLQLVGSGQTGQIGVNLIAGKELDYSVAANRDAFYAIQIAQNDALVERMRITSAGTACFAGTLCAPIITSKASTQDITGIALLTTLETANALYILTVQPEAGSGTSAAALITSRTNQSPSIQTIVSSSSLSFIASGQNICLCSNLGYTLTTRWGIIRLA
jgi:hypothetical protein